MAFPTLSDEADITVFAQATMDAIAEVGTWQAYTPAWTAATTNPALGNGILTGRFARIGDTIHYSISLIFGSTTTRGAGHYIFSLPASVAGPSLLPLGIARMRDSAPVARAGRTAHRFTATTLALESEGGVLLGHDNPWLWAVDDVLHISGSYEAV